MKKILFLYIFGTTLPIILFITEKNIPFDILNDLTILANDIKISSYSGLISSVFMIILGSIILKSNLKDKTYDFLIKLNLKSISYLTIYGFFRIFNSLFIFLNFNKLSRPEVQLLEQTIRSGFPGFLIQISNSLYPIITTIVFCFTIYRQIKSNF